MKHLGYLIAIAVAIAIGVPEALATGFPSCAELQFGNGWFVPGDHASHHAPGDTHGIMGGVLSDGTQLPKRNLAGIDDVYTVPGSNTKFVQCYCSQGDPDLPDGLGIQSNWQVVDACPFNLSTGEACDPFGCHWNIPFYSSCNTPGCCKPAVARHSAFFQCRPRCGDGVLQNGEECDDGNRVSGDSCSANCDIEVSCLPPTSCDSCCPAPPACNSCCPAQRVCPPSRSCLLDDCSLLYGDMTPVNNCVARTMSSEQFEKRRWATKACRALARGCRGMNRWRWFISS